MTYAITKKKGWGKNIPPVPFSPLGQNLLKGRNEFASRFFSKLGSEIGLFDLHIRSETKPFSRFGKCIKPKHPTYMRALDGSLGN